MIDTEVLSKVRDAVRLARKAGQESPGTFTREIYRQMAMATFELLVADLLKESERDLEVNKTIGSGDPVQAPSKGDQSPEGTGRSHEEAPESR